MAQEHQEYIQTKVNPILENLVTQVLLERPDNPVPFMVRWLANQSPQAKEYFDGFGVGEAEKLRTEVKSLQEEVAALESKLGRSAPAAAAAAAPPKEKKKEESDLSDEDEDDEEGPEDIPPPPASYINKGPRSSVSAEAYGDWNKQKAFTPPVHEKTEEQKTKILEVLERSFLFNSLGKLDKGVIVLALTEKVVGAGDKLITEGEDGDCMYLIEEGVAECIKKINGEEKVVKTCHAGDVFGELALLYNCPRAATVAAKESLKCWRLDRESFNAIVRDASMKKREMYETFLKTVPLLKSLGGYERSQLADALRKELVPAGSAVVTQGEEGKTFYIVEEGDLYANRDEKEVKTYGKGDYFGELALLKNQVRAATVIARTDSVVLSVDRRSFESMLGDLRAELQEAADRYDN